MKVIKSTDSLKGLSESETLWAYNGFDCCITHEIWPKLEAKLDPENTRVTYEFLRAIQAPALTMGERGIRIDTKKRDELIEKTKARLFKLGGMEQNEKGQWKVTDQEATIQRVAHAIWGKSLNYNSNPQLMGILYKSLGVPEQKKNDKGRWRVTTDREALEKIEKSYPRARVFCKILLRIRDLEKKLSVLNTPLDRGRWKYSFNVAGTETGRFSSKSDVFGYGANIQNIADELREMFIPDEGMVMFYADLKSAESVAVGYLSGDEDYIEACNTGDPHTVVAKLVWPDRPWTGNLKEDKKYAGETNYYREYTYRDMSKRGGHGTNYYGTPPTMSRHLRVEQKIMHRFQALYYGADLYLRDIYRWGFRDLLKHGTVLEVPSNHPVRKFDTILRIEGAFPGIRKWHDKTIDTLQLEGFLVTPLKRKRKFWGRLWDKATWREAIAFIPQSLISDILKIGLFKVWKKYEPVVQVLADGHDAIFGQLPAELVDEYRDKIVSEMEFDVPVNGRMMRIKADIKFGPNWRYVSDNKYAEEYDAREKMESAKH